MKKTNRGFTLIELLVVIAIIGVLSSVVLVSLGNAKTRGVNGGIKSNMYNARTQSEFYYNDNFASYTGVCGTAPTANGIPSIYDGLKQAQAAWGTTSQPINNSLLTGGGWDTTTCHANAAAFAAEVPMKESANGAPVMWCIDSNNFSAEVTTNLGSGDVTCN